MKIITASDAALQKVGYNLAKKLRGGEVILLSGDLGAGKTTLVKGLAKGLAIKNNISSPTFVIYKPYVVKHKTIKTFVHVDVYRLDKKTLFEDIGLADYLDQPDTVMAIEWATKLALPKNIKTINVDITVNKNNSRQIIIK